MKRSIKLQLTIVGTIVSISACSHATKPQQVAALKFQSNPAELVDSLNHVFGDHKQRASHAKGFCATGTFTPNEHASHLSKTVLFAAPSQASVRFSIGGGNPKVSDKSHSIRGLAARLSHAGQSYDLLMISEPVFFAATTESFVSFLKARVPDPATKKPNPESVIAHSEKYPESKLQGTLVAAHAAPSSYASTPYFTTNAFGLVNAKQHTQWARLSLAPVDGKHYLTEEQEKSLSDNFLEDEMHARLKNGAAKFTLYAQLAEPTDTLTNPTVEWPAERKQVELGVLSIDTATAQACVNKMFNPTNLPDGIVASDDPILHARAGAYAVSRSRR
ncbi:MAG: catalase family peroxidase [Methylotenera sp.]